MQQEAEEARLEAEKATAIAEDGAGADAEGADSEAASAGKKKKKRGTRSKKNKNKKAGDHPAPRKSMWPCCPLARSSLPRTTSPVHELLICRVARRDCTHRCHGSYTTCPDTILAWMYDRLQLTALIW